MTEQPRLLSARPGRVRYVKGPNGRQIVPTTDLDQDYTSSSRAAVHSEPEAVPEQWQREHSASTRDRERVAKVTADAERNAHFASLAAKLAADADALDKAMRAAGVHRDTYRQIAHCTRAANTARKMLTPP